MGLAMGTGNPRHSHYNVKFSFVCRRKKVKDLASPVKVISCSRSLLETLESHYKSKEAVLCLRNQ